MEEGGGVKEPGGGPAGTVIHTVDAPWSCANKSQVAPLHEDSPAG